MSSSVGSARAVARRVLGSALAVVFALEATYVLWVTAFVILPWRQTFARFDRTEEDSQLERVLILLLAGVLALLLLKASLSTWRAARGISLNMLALLSLSGVVLMHLGLLALTLSNLVTDPASETAWNAAFAGALLILSALSIWVLTSMSRIRGRAG